MNHLDFKHSTLYISLRSPFARRVRLAFLENGIPFQEQVCDVFHPSPELILINPLARVPLLKLKSNEVIIDSNLILQIFYRHYDSPFIGKSVSEEVEISYWAALATGLYEKTIDYFLDSLRPQGHQDKEIASELEGVSQRVLTLIEKQLSEKGDFLVGARLTQADLDIGTGLTYLGFRYSDTWKNQFPQTKKYLETLENRETFIKTRPVPQ